MQQTIQGCCDNSSSDRTGNRTKEIETLGNSTCKREIHAFLSAVCLTLYSLIVGIFLRCYRCCQRLFGTSERCILRNERSLFLFLTTLLGRLSHILLTLIHNFFLRFCTLLLNIRKVFLMFLFISKFLLTILLILVIFLANLDISVQERICTTHNNAGSRIAHTAIASGNINGRRSDLSSKTCYLLIIIVNRSVRMTFLPCSWRFGSGSITVRRIAECRITVSIYRNTIIYNHMGRIASRTYIRCIHCYGIGFCVGTRRVDVGLRVCSAPFSCCVVDGLPHLSVDIVDCHFAPGFKHGFQGRLDSLVGTFGIVLHFSKSLSYGSTEIFDRLHKALHL